MKASQKRVGGVVIVVVVVAVVLVAVIGWMARRSSQVTMHSQASAQQASSVPAPKLITYDPIVVVEHPEEVQKLTGAPDSFKSFVRQTIIGNNAEMAAAGEVGHCVMSVAHIYDQKIASGTTTCNPDAAALWVLKDNVWMTIDTSQDAGFHCDTLRRYKVPASVAGTTCYDDKGASSYKG